MSDKFRGKCLCLFTRAKVILPCISNKQDREDNFEYYINQQRILSVCYTYIVIFHWLPTELWWIILSKGHNNLATGQGEFKLGDQQTGTVPHCVLPATSCNHEKHFKTLKNCHSWNLEGCGAVGHAVVMSCQGDGFDSRVSRPEVYGKTCSVKSFEWSSALYSIYSTVIENINNQNKISMLPLWFIWSFIRLLLSMHGEKKKHFTYESKDKSPHIILHIVLFIKTKFSLPTTEFATRLISFIVQCPF